MLSDKKNELVEEKEVYSRYLIYREQVLKCTANDINLKLTRDDQVYIAVFDIPLKSIVVGGQTETLALVFGLNAHLYYGTGSAFMDLEKDPEVRKVMNSLMLSIPQALPVMRQTNDTKFYNSNYIRVYLKTRKGIYFSELKGEVKEEKFMIMLLGQLMKAINNVIQR